MEHQKIDVLWNKEITEIKGDKKVSSVTVRNVLENSEEDMPIDGVFLAIGHTPNVSFLDGMLELDEKGYIKTGFTTDTSTSIPGIFAAGDVADSVYRQAVTAAGTGCQAAIDAERWLDN
jgi:thioredoxin reductase (NADPH)